MRQAKRDDLGLSGDRPTHRNPHTGERITLLATAEETGGEATRMEIRVQPNRTKTPATQRVQR
jgi:hypothetical protein